MPERMNQELYVDLVSRLTDRQFLKAVKLSKKAMLKLIQAGNWKANIRIISGAEKVSCRDVLRLCEPVLSGLSEEPEKGWLRDIYDDILNRLFPGKMEKESDCPPVAGRFLFLEVLRFFLEYERKNRPFDPKSHLEFLMEDEYGKTDSAGEYRTLLDIIRGLYLYEFMRIGAEITEYQTLAHIAGVHYISMHIGKQLADAGVPIDIALLSGAAFGHDIGKYGCRPEEAKRIPYLHYYYTDLYFQRNHMPSIGHIAANHSTWDLELENLSVESLVLIYADFRVKSVKGPDSGERVQFFSLKDSFQVILDKLDNVDEAKRARYTRVYAKLKDFEDYMEGLGINTDLTTGKLNPPEKKDAALYNPEEVVRALKHLAIRHNIMVMHKFNGETSFSNLLEAARSEKNWKNMRAYINIFQEYFSYMTQKQKLMTLSFLYELLMNREGDIRRQSASLLGNIIVHYDAEYRKELPEGVSREPDEITSLGLWEKYLALIIHPDHKVTEQHRRWLGYTLKLVVSSALEHCGKADAGKYKDIFLRYYREEDYVDSTAFILLDSVDSLPLNVCSKEDKLTLMKFALHMVLRESAEVRIASLRCICHLSEDSCCREEWISMVPEYLDRIGTTGKAGEVYLIRKTLNNLGLGGRPGLKTNAENPACEAPGVSSEIFLENLKAATPWILKIVNLDLLLDQTREENGGGILQIAAHLSNLIKVSETVAVRHKAGEVLLSIIPLLTLDQRNEIAVELSKGLEIGQYEFSKYIPEYLGELALYLHPNELDELILDFRKMLASRNERVCSVTLDTLGVMLENYSCYLTRFREDPATVHQRREVILGLILKGLSDYHDAVSQEAFLVIGQKLFGSPKLTLEEKYKIFATVCKKMLTLITDQSETELSFFNSAASLNHIYRFISEFLFYHGDFKLPVIEDIAFFPGSFDPFSLGHKEIVSMIRDLGFEVYLSIDEFFWSKKSQPKMIRRQILRMSIAEEKNIYLFPDEIPINIGNPSDLKKLREELFPGRNVYIVAGSDVIDNASAYQAPPEENSIHSFPHIIFERSETARAKAYPMLSGGIRRFTLPPKLEEISSTKIRENIDSNRDISNLIDPLAQSYIYENSLYLREPTYKQVIDARGVRFEIIERFDEQLVREVEEAIFGHRENKACIRPYLLRKGVKAVLIRDGERDNRPVAMAAFHEIGMADLYGEFGSLKLVSHIRSITSGKIIVLSGVAEACGSTVKNAAQLAITEALAHCLKDDFTYAIYHDHLGVPEGEIGDLLGRQGFQPIYSEEGGFGTVYAVDMKFPVTFFSDIETTVKEPFNRLEKVLNVIGEAHNRIQWGLAKLYPGNLILTFDADVMNRRIIEMITRENKVPNKLLPVRQLGEYMCVPFGKILKGMAVPNTVTKALHTEKRFEPGIDAFEITEFPYYSPLVTQVRTIKSFRRPVLLVDDLLHKGYRMRELDPILKQEGVEVSKIIVGILSGRGKDLMALQGREVDSVYFIPNMRSWFVESSMYPFLGGDGVRREGKSRNGIVNAGLIPSINLILPYVAPRFLSGIPKSALYDFSLICLENARSILIALEEEYQRVYEKNLTLNRLSEAVFLPRYPDKGLNMSYDLNLPPSVYVENDIELLKRLENIILEDRI